MKVLSFIMVMLCSLHTWAMSCENLFLPLSSYQKALLRHARFLGEHDYKVLKVNVDGVKKNVVILEENRHHSKYSSETGKAIVKTFNFFGLEGYNPKLYFGSNVLSRHFNKFLKFLDKQWIRIQLLVALQVSLHARENVAGAPVVPETTLGFRSGDLPNVRRP